MGSFKEQIGKDITDVFLNKEEFSDVHTIDGKAMTVQVDDNEAIERQMREVKPNTEGVYVKQKLIYVSEAEFGDLPFIGRLLRLDGKLYRVVDAASEAGIHSITLEANKS